jgi:cytochrome c5
MKNHSKLILAFIIFIFGLSACLNQKNDSPLPVSDAKIIKVPGVTDVILDSAGIKIVVPATVITITTPAVTTPATNTTPATTTPAGNASIISGSPAGGTVVNGVSVVGNAVNSISYVTDIEPLVKMECLSCHKAPSNSGGINLETYAQVKKYVDNGKFYGSISGATGYVKMPPSGLMANAVLINVKSWIAAGSPNAAITGPVVIPPVVGTPPPVVTPPVTNTPPPVVNPPAGTVITIDCPTGLRLAANGRVRGDDPKEEDKKEEDKKDGGTSPGIGTGTATVCFDSNILPFFQSNCATSGCHNKTSKVEGYDLSSYVSIISKGLNSGNPGASKIYKVMTSTGKDRMPPAPYSPVSKTNLDAISKWITEGAQNKICGTTGGNTGGTGTGGTGVGTGNGGTNSVVVNFVAVNSIIKANCVSCHKVGNASAGIALDSYTEIKKYGTNGRLYGSISGATGFKLMPPGGGITTCDIALIKKWIDVGMPNN